MKRLLTLLFSLAATSAFAAKEVPTRYIVQTRQPVKSTRLRMVTNAETAQRLQVRTFQNLNAFGATLTAAEVNELRQSGDVVSVQPVVERHALGLGPSTGLGTNASKFTTQVTPWGVDAAHVPEVWKVTRGAKNVNVAILDTGIDPEHPELKHAFAGQYNVMNPGTPAKDDNKHGTHVAGTIAAADNQIGVVGIAPNVNIWAVKVLNWNGDGTDETVALGMDWVVSKKRELGGHWIINLSLGAARPSDVEREATARAITEGVIVVAGAGNRQRASVDYPAGYDGVIAVGALTEQNKLAEFSSFGTGLTVCAPGMDVPSTVPVGFAKIAEVEIGGKSYNAVNLTGSPLSTVSGDLVYCGYGRPEDFPANMQGKIALMARGANVYFREKARNAKNAGAVAAVIFNDNDDNQDIYSPWTLSADICNENGCTPDPSYAGFVPPLTIAISNKDGLSLVSGANRPAIASARLEDYMFLSGTSMATPHVTGAVALLLSLKPLNTSQIEFALIATADDLGDSGWDLMYGYGGLNVLRAAQFIAPERFGVEPFDPWHGGRRRSSRH